MKIPVYLDIETIPDQRPDAVAAFIQDAYDNFKAPQNITKSRMGIDLGMTEHETKYTAKAELIAQWEGTMRDQCHEDLGREKWRQTSLRGGEGKVFAIGYAVAGGPVEVVHLNSPDDCESTLLKTFFTDVEYLVDQAVDAAKTGVEPFFVGHNVPFDIGFLYRACVVNRYRPSCKLPHNGQHGVDFYDTMQAWAGIGRRISQDDLSRILGLPLKPEGITGANVWDHIQAGNIEEVIEYNRHDVTTVRSIYRALEFIREDQHATA